MFKTNKHCTLNKIIPVHHNKHRKQSSENQHSRATRAPVLCNTARVVQNVQKNAQLIFISTGALTRVPVLCNTARVVQPGAHPFQLRGATRAPVLCNTARVAERAQDFPETAAAQKTAVQTRGNVRQNAHFST